MKLRIATFNLENLDKKETTEPSFEKRIQILRPQLIRLRADIICFQEIHSQKKEGQKSLTALKELLEKTPYQNYQKAVSRDEDGQLFSQRNLVTASRFKILESHSYTHQFTPSPQYETVTAEKNELRKITWERPILRSVIDLNGRRLNLLNLHLKSKIPTNINGQKVDNYTWKTASGWAEGYFLSSMRRVGQALETRVLVDKLFDEDLHGLIVIAGDFNADFDEVPVEAILGRVENTGNGELAERVLIPCENTIPETSRYTLYHHGKKNMLDHLIISRGLLPFYRHTEIHNETLSDESVAFAGDVKFPESDHAPVVAEFEIV
jgi:endonuclease/exonuclease/phosphatase family metal-dependent hydrolase